MIISIHALLAESDGTLQSLVSPGEYFYPRSPCGERLILEGVPLRFLDISIHALLAESDPSHASPYFHQPISIHALLAESDCQPVGAIIAR